ncbi:MAG: MFS transporter [Alphaproteobacteria bacterium]
MTTDNQQSTTGTGAVPASVVPTSAVSTGAAPAGRGQVIGLVAVLAAIYVVSQLLRNSVGVIAPDLARDLALAPTELGILSGAFFFSFAAVQLPLGVALDRWGPRATMLGSGALAVAGTLLFAAADGLGSLTLARVAMGLGCSTFYMAPLTIYTRWFAQDRFSSIVSVQYGLGNIGSLLATAPLAFMAGWVGWRGSFVLVGVVTVVVLVGVGLVARDAPPGQQSRPHPRESLAQSIAGIGQVMRQKDVWRLFAMNVVAYSSFVTILGLWAGPFLSDMHGLGLQERGNALLVLAVSQIGAIFLWGPVDRLVGARKLPVLCGVAGQIVVLSILALAPNLPLTLVLVLFVVLGATSAYLPVLVAHGRALFDQRLIGRGLTFLNMAGMGGVFLVQSTTGWLADLVDGSAAVRDAGAPLSAIAYQSIFGFLAISLIVAVAIYARADDRPPGK